MITKGGSRTNRRFFAKHFLNTKDNERARVVGVYGFGHEEVNDAWRDLEAFAQDRPNCKNYFYTVSLNPEPGEELTDAQWKQAEEIALQKLGLEGQPYISFEHEKKGRIHRHIAASRIDMDSGKVISDSLGYAKHEAISRDIEREFGLHATESVLVKDRGSPRPERRPKDYETFRGSRTGIKPQDVTAEVTPLWHKTDSAQGFQAALEEHGYTLCEGDRSAYCIIDRAGKEHSLARRISGVKTAEIRERLKELEETLPSIGEAREAHPERIRAAGIAKFKKSVLPLRRAIERNGELEEIGGVQDSGSWWERSPHFFRSAAKEYQPEAAETSKAAKDWRDKIRETGKAKRAKEKSETWKEYVKSPRHDDQEPEISR